MRRWGSLAPEASDVGIDGVRAEGSSVLQPLEEHLMLSRNTVLKLTLVHYVHLLPASALGKS
jgi:hypothetical protein